MVVSFFLCERVSVDLWNYIISNVLDEQSFHPLPHIRVFWQKYTNDEKFSKYSREVVVTYYDDMG